MPLKKINSTTLIFFIFISTYIYASKSVDLPKSNKLKTPPLSLNKNTQNRITSIENFIQNRVEEIINLKKVEEENGKAVQWITKEYKVIYTLDLGLQKLIHKIFEKYKVPLGSAVVLNAKTGEVLALVHYCNSNNCQGVESPLSATAPSASLFKIITASAALELFNDVTPETKFCYHGGHRKIVLSLLIPNPKKDSICIDFAGAFGFSVNTVFARLGVRIGVNKLKEYAERFGYNSNIPFDLPVDISRFEVPQDELTLGRVAAGFWYSYLSPFHAALIMQAIALDGNMLRPYIVEKILTKGGRIIKKQTPRLIKRIISSNTTQKLKELLLTTVTRGTAKDSFFDKKGKAIIPEIKVGGKTGTLHSYNPFKEFSWFAGIAPLENPNVAFSILLINNERWRIKAHFVGREITRYYSKKNTLFTNPLK